MVCIPQAESNVRDLCTEYAKYTEVDDEVDEDELEDDEEYEDEADEVTAL